MFSNQENEMAVANEKKMISIDDAVECVLSNAEKLPTMTVSTRGCRNYVLAEPVFADLDAPAFNRAMMDGYALKAEYSKEGKEIPVVGMIPAGEFRSEPVPDGNAVKIMTGAPVPDDCDAVIQVELTEEISENLIRLETSFKPGNNISMKGEEVKKGDQVLPAGVVIDPATASVLAMMGQHKVRITQPPRVGILVTGNELVSPGMEIIGQGQIRESNSYGLMAQTLSWGAVPMKLGQVIDEPGHLADALEKGLSNNVLAITGGVSMGDFDLVPDTLRELGVQVLFHKVAQKPGKPILFGKRGSTLVFGLPGNPVACYLGFELYAGPAIRRMAGEVDYETPWYTGTTAGEFRIKTDRPHFKGAKIEWSDEGWLVHPTKSMGSADIISVVGTDAFVRFEKGRYSVPAGEKVKFCFHRGKPNGS